MPATIPSVSLDELNAALPDMIRVSRILDSGDQGTVYVGTAEGVEAAIKVYSTGQVVRRTDREVEALGRISCPRIARLLWSGELSLGHDVHQVVATALVPGETLANVIGRGALDHQALSVLGHDVAEAVESMWALRVVHRDLKPSNVIIQPDGRACVIDLGIARLVRRSALTAFGTTWGTLGYMSPEQTDCVRLLTCKSDLFSLAIVLLEAAMGRHPTRGDQLRLLAANYHSRLPVEVANWAHAPLLQQLLQPQPTRRPLPAQVLEQLRLNSTHARRKP